MLNDETFVSSLFDINPNVIGEMAFLLDMQKVGLKNWQSLAAQLGIPRNDFKSFETLNPTSPTENLFELLTVFEPQMTIGELVRHLETIRRHDVINAIRKSAKGKKLNVIFYFYKQFYLNSNTIPVSLPTFRHPSHNSHVLSTIISTCQILHVNLGWRFDDPSAVSYL